jgi:D-alanyl-D-alanine carboxypeptidase
LFDPQMRIWLLLLALLMPVTAQPHLPATGSNVVELFELAPTAPPTPVIKARSAILVDLDSGKTLFQLDPHGRHAPASLTKVVTALVALDRLRLEQTVTVPVSINQLPWDSTRMGLRPGERLTVRELLYGLFLNSGNDAAITLSEAAMPRATFVALMNARAAALTSRRPPTWARRPPS